MRGYIRDRAILALAVAAALSGCATGTWNTPGPLAAASFALPTLAPGASAIEKEGLSIDRWWSAFDDSRLDRLMDEALRRNADLESAAARVREARASLEVTGAAEQPSVDFQVQNGREQRSTVGPTPLPPGVDRLASDHRAALSASYEADFWGKLSSSSEAARQRLLGSEWARATVEWSLTAQLADTYFSLAAVDRQVEISEAVRAGREAAVRLRKRETAAGAGSEFDLRRAQAELTGTDATLAGLRRQRVSLERALYLLLGRTPAEIASGVIERGALDEGEAPVALLPHGAAAEMLSRRPDIRQAEAQLAAANASIAAARAATLPSLRLTGSIGSDAKSLADLFTGPAGIWSFAASVAQPIFDGGRLKARVREEYARAQQALSNYRKTVAAAFLDIREAYASLDLTSQAYRAQHERVEALSRAKDLATLGHENGAFGYLEQLDAERNWYQAQLDQVSAARDRLSAQIAAFKALGGGYAHSNPQLASD
jgi:multidrug efflux system outer membrane protein